MAGAARSARGSSRRQFGRSLLGAWQRLQLSDLHRPRARAIPRSHRSLERPPLGRIRQPAQSLPQLREPCPPPPPSCSSISTATSRRVGARGRTSRRRRSTSMATPPRSAAANWPRSERSGPAWRKTTPRSTSTSRRSTPALRPTTSRPSSPSAAARAIGTATTAGGISFVGGFYNAASNVGYAFSGTLGGNTKNTAEAAAHEAGHLFGLQHQAQWNGSIAGRSIQPRQQRLGADHGRWLLPAANNMAQRHHVLWTGRVPGRPGDPLQRQQQLRLAARRLRQHARDRGSLACRWQHRERGGFDRPG